MARKKSKARKVYLLGHSRYIDAEQIETDDKILGVFTSLRKAKAAKKRAAQLPGFKDRDCRFTIDLFLKNEMHWAEGFVTVTSPRIRPTTWLIDRRHDSLAGREPISDSDWQALLQIDSLDAEDTADRRKLKRLVSHPECLVRSAAIEALAFAKHASIRMLFVHALRDPEPLVRVAAVEALGIRGRPKDLAFVIPMLGDSERAVRICAADTVGYLDNPDGVKPLERLAISRSKHERGAAMASLVQLGRRERFKELLALLDARDPLARNGVVRAFASVASGEYYEKLTLQSDEERAALAEALKRRIPREPLDWLRAEMRLLLTGVLRLQLKRH